MGEAGLSMAKYFVLQALAEAGEPLTLTELAAGQHCVRSNITQLVDRLEADGLVKRVDDPADRRTIRASLTASGKPAPCPESHCRRNDIVPASLAFTHASRIRPMLAGVAPSQVARPRSATLHVALWIAQVLLFALFAFAGSLKLMTPIAQLTQTIPWAADVPLGLVRFIGLAELAGALGLLLPSLTRIKPALTPLAALGLLVTMVLATGFHVMRGELAALGMPLLLGALAGFVAWGRFRKAPISAREVNRRA